MNPDGSRPPKWWTDYFLGMAEYVSRASKDPSTKVGAVIVRPDKTIASVGFNGFPRGIADTPELLANREEKYRRVVHSEINAILHAPEPVRGHTLYLWPLLSCERCAVHIIQVGIARVVAPKNDNPRWDFTLTRALYAEAGVECIEV